MKSFKLCQKVIVLLSALACGQQQAAARSVRKLRTSSVPVSSDLRPDTSKETLLVEHNADLLLRFLDASSRNSSSATAVEGSENASSEKEAAATVVEAAPEPAPAPAPPAPAPPATASQPQVSYEEFRVQCLQHVHQLVDNIDHSYTDVQMENALKHECQLESEFPASKEDGFHTEAACHDFAELLTKARNEELSTGSQAGYEEFCQKYYKHRNAHPIGTPTAKPLYVNEYRKVEQPPTTTTTTEEKTTTTAAPKEKGISMQLWAVLIVLVVVVVAGIALARR